MGRRIADPTKGQIIGACNCPECSELTWIGPGQHPAFLDPPRHHPECRLNPNRVELVYDFAPQNPQATEER